MEETELIGLTIGDTPDLNQEINEKLPGTVTTPAGTVEVGINTKAELSASSDDATITPDYSKNASTPDKVDLMWTWEVTPKRPADELILTAHIEVPVDGGGSFNTDIPLRIHVKRSIGYTAGQAFHNWATLSAIAASAAAVVGWFLRRRKRDQRSNEGSLFTEPKEPGTAGREPAERNEAAAPHETG
ncbi:hypothetical protein GO011_09525 [Mycobacterium sp. 20091114027_K0903767]|nr:hypothetical protein [Mycobacterium sp. 20091114027_K0903767]